MAFVITSPAFADHGEIPARFTCEGADISPALHWSGAPQSTKSFALIIDDPDAPDPRAPQRTWVHWVVYNIPADAEGLAEDAAAQGLPSGARQGINDWKRAGYGGPCPPVGRHRYFHRLYALDSVLPDLVSPTKAKLLAAMKSHLLAEAQLVGSYQKGG
jgi:Raf kinase inhibitor-like YbhB/YbcL family protein